MKQELSIFVLFNTSLKMTTFLGITISKIALICTKDASIEGTYMRDIFVRSAWAESPCVRGASAVKHLEIDSQCF